MERSSSPNKEGQDQNLYILKTEDLMPEVIDSTSSSKELVLNIFFESLILFLN